MKKKSCLMLAMLLAMLQIIAVFAVVPASATVYEYLNYGRTYDIYKSTADITVDGTADTAWANIPWSEYFVCSRDTGDGKGVTSDFKARLKAVWYPIENDDANMMFYVLVDIKNADATDTPKFKLNVNAMNSSVWKSWTGEKLINGDSKTNDVNNVLFKWDATGSEGDYVLEVSAKIPKSDSFRFDLYIKDYPASYETTYCWNGVVDGNGNQVDMQILGVGNVKNSTSPVANPLAGVSVVATNGASIRLDTAKPNQSGIRFATTVTVPEGVTIKETGTLVLPTATLESRWMIDSMFNETALALVGTNRPDKRGTLTEGTDYYVIKNVGNTWIDGTTNATGGTFYGTLYDVKNNTRAFAGIGYAVVEVDGVEYTVFAEFDRANHSRSIAQVAQNAIDLGIYATDSDEYKLLLGFTGAEA